VRNLKSRTGKPIRLKRTAWVRLTWKGEPSNVLHGGGEIEEEKERTCLHESLFSGAMKPSYSTLPIIHWGRGGGGKKREKQRVEASGEREERGGNSSSGRIASRKRGLPSKVLSKI